MASYQQVSIILNLVDVTGAKIGQGSAKIVPSVTLTDASDNLEVPPAPAWASFNGVTFPSVTVYATDSAGLLPSGWGLDISYPGVPGNPASQTFFAPAGPLSFTAANASPCVFTWTPASRFTVMPDSAAVQLSGPSLPAGFSAGTTYYVVNASGQTFQLAATVNGTPLASTGSGSGTLIVTAYYLSSLTPVSSVVTMAAFMPLPSGTAASGQVPVATGSGAGSAWGSVPVNPMTTPGDTVYGGTAGAFTRLAGDTSNTRKFLREQSSAGVAQPPAWDTIQAADVPTLNQNTTGSSGSCTGNAATATTAAACSGNSATATTAAACSGNAATAANLAAGTTLPAYLAPKAVTLADASSVAIDASLGNYYQLLMTSAIGASRTIAAPTNPVNGDSFVIAFQQPASGGPCAPSFASGAAGYSFGTDGTPTWSTSASVVDEIGFRYHGPLGKWVCQGWKLNFS